MLVQGFPENWWEWHELIGPLAADGYRVLCPDLRGAGFSSAPRLPQALIRGPDPISVPFPAL
jgi:pimeloyl-ACP methyl ester carboxylesterase